MLLSSLSSPLGTVCHVITRRLQWVFWQRSREAMLLELLTSVYCCYQPLVVPKLQMKLCHRFARLCSKITWQSCVTSGLRDSPNVLEYIPCRQGNYKTQLNAQPAIHPTCATLVSTVHFLICKPLDTDPTKHISKGYHSNLTSLVQNTASTNKE